MITEKVRLSKPSVNKKNWRGSVNTVSVESEITRKGNRQKQPFLLSIMNLTILAGTFRVKRAALGIVYIYSDYNILTAISNEANITDGLDGLATTSAI